MAWSDRFFGGKTGVTEILKVFLVSECFVIDFIYCGMIFEGRLNVV